MIMPFRSNNPYTGQFLADYPTDSPADVERKLARAEAGFAEWSVLTVAQRTPFFRRVADYLTANRHELAAGITAEMGKTLREAVAEIEKCAGCCTFYADHAETFLADQLIESDAAKSYTTYQPLGPVLAVMPWNFPFWQVFRFAVPGLLAGNVGLLKHAPNVGGCAQAIETVFTNCGFPAGAFQSLFIEPETVETILRDWRVRAVTLTGSGRAGSSVAAIAGHEIKKAVLELGGSDALIVLADADLERAAEVAVKSRMQNAGQSCIAAKRFIVEKSVKAQFTELVMHHVSQITQGDPTADETTMGPMARPDLADAIDNQCRTSVSQGAKLLTEPKRNECNVAPMVLTDVRPGMVVFDEETFGPLAAIIEAANERDAVRLANQSQFGLGSAIWTQDIDRAERLARQIEAGSVFINGLMRSDSRVPFGGVKHSGFGRELADAGIREFTNLKTVWIDS